MNRRTKFDKNKIILHENHAEIELYNRKCEPIAYTKIDLEDIDKVKNVKWFLDKKRGYTIGKLKGNIKIRLHRFLMNCKKYDGNEIDHKNRNKLDNMKNNLRFVTRSENMLNINKRIDNTSGHKGVYFHKNEKKWSARLSIKGESKYLGFFDQKEDAIKARKDAELKMGVIA